MKEKLGFENLIGETITAVVHITTKGYDDDGDIILITKNKKFKIQGYGEEIYTGKSEGEYPNRLSCNEMIDKCDCGFFEGKRGECVCGKRWCK